MIRRWVVYLAVLAGFVSFYLAYREWISWVLLLYLLALPWLSFLLSLPAMLTARARAEVPLSCAMGEGAQARLDSKGPLPLPQIRSRLFLTHTITGERRKAKCGDALPTEHCGVWHISLRKPRVYDYLGFFSLPVRRREAGALRVEPKPLPMENPPDISRYLASAWKPKPGGGFSENHELRLYRPGDSLHQIHWKLTAKTGKLILREPMEAQRGKAVVTMILEGDGETIDSRLGRLLWLGDYLLERDMPFELRCLTGSGLLCFGVPDREELSKAMGTLLETPAAREGILPEMPDASWQYHIGGDADGA